MTAAASIGKDAGEDLARVNDTVTRARQAQETFARASQAEVDLACLAAAAPVMRDTDNQRLAEMAVAETNLGNVADKIRKNRRKTLGLLRDIRGQKTVGIIAEDRRQGWTEIARPLGIVAALTPSTNPVATPVNKTVNALKGGNAIILAPPPQAAKTGAALLQLIHQELKKIGAPPDLVQMLLPPSKAATARLMQLADFIVVTGSQRNVRGAYSSGTPAVGVGAGNVAVIIDETADPAIAAEKIAASKTFDNATSCSSENHLVIIESAYTATLAALQKAGGILLSPAEKAKLQEKLWIDGALNRQLIARDMPVFAATAGLSEAVAQSRFIMVEENGVGPDFPYSGEKLSLALTLYRAADFAAAKEKVNQLLHHQGAGHSVGIHTEEETRPLELGLTLPACRVIVNQAHCFANGGSFDNALPFSLSMGCGSWGGNSISDNLNHRHFINTVRVIRPIPPDEPTVEDLYADYPNH